MNERQQRYKRETETALISILNYWMKFTPDPVHGGFYGRVDAGNHADPHAPKGAVLNSRILWTFSAAALVTNNKDYEAMAHRAYDYLVRHFPDTRYGGVYWTVDAAGKPLDTRKQVYAIAFALYGITEYYKLTASKEVLQVCISLYNVIEQHSFDKKHGGYVEAFSRDWKSLADLRLSNKDANEKKTMNTHLHILEAYTNLYRIWPDRSLRIQISRLIDNFLQHIIDKNSFHLHLFFDEEWMVKSDTVSYGHDIEAAWLIPEAAETIGWNEVYTALNAVSVKMASAAAEGLDKDGGLWYENEVNGQRLVKEKHWWPQAEAMVGFLHSWEKSGNGLFFNQSIECWEFIKKYIIVPDGEWHWGIREDYSVMPNQDKAGLWKCPYHNGRACMEIMRRLG